METSLLALYLQLFHCDWLYPAQFARHLKLAGSIHRFLAMDDETLGANGFTAFQITCLRRVTGKMVPRQVDDDLSWAEVEGNNIVCFEDPRYPRLLREIDVAPPVLFVRGDIDTLSKPQLAIVGSRKATSYGLRNAYWMANALGMAGLGITSGMARGIDTRAHQGALASGSSTVAIIGTGADQVYPAANQLLADAIAAQGAVVSEFPLGTPPIPANFPRRNRIMSGLSMGTLVVEATLRSGTLITAKLALEQNREVFAIPGPINNPQSAGCHQLINDGARLVTRPEDILQEFGVAEAEVAQSDDQQATTSNSSLPKGQTTPANPSRLAKMIGYQGCELQYLLETSGLEHQALLNRLLELEIAGEIHVAGGRYYRA